MRRSTICREGCTYVGSYLQPLAGYCSRRMISSSAGSLRPLCCGNRCHCPHGFSGRHRAIEVEVTATVPRARRPPKRDRGDPHHHTTDGRGTTECEAFSFFPAGYQVAGTHWLRRRRVRWSTEVSLTTQAWRLRDVLGRTWHANAPPYFRTGPRTVGAAHNRCRRVDSHRARLGNRGLAGGSCPSFGDTSPG